MSDFLVKMMNGNQLITVTFFILNVILFNVQAALAQQRQSHWLVGQWEGKIERYLPKQNPGRTLLVLSVSPDGNAQARWAITGQAASVADVNVNAGKVAVVTGAESLVELAREGDGLLGLGHLL